MQIWPIVVFVTLVVLGVVVFRRKSKPMIDCEKCGQAQAHEISRSLSHTSTFKEASDAVSRPGTTWIREHFIVRYTCEACGHQSEKAVSRSKRGLA